MPSVYEDNFGFYCTDDDPDELAFFMHIKWQSIAKVCARCNQKVRLQPQISLCNLFTSPGIRCTIRPGVGRSKHPLFIALGHGFFYLWPQLSSVQCEIETRVRNIVAA